METQYALGALGALGSALTWAVISLQVRALAPQLSSVTVNASRSLLGTVVLVGWVLVTAGPGAITGMPLRVVGLLWLSVVVASAVGDTVFFESTRHLGLARAMTLSMVYPLLAALLAALLLGEPLTLPALLGALITLAGIGLIVTGEPGHGGGDGRFRVGVTAALGAAVAWAVSVILLKAPLGEVDAVAAQAVRLPAVGVVLLLGPWGWHSPGELRRGGWRTAVRLALVGALTALSSVAFVAGVKYAGITVATVLSSTAPMFAIPLGMLLLGERPTARSVIGTAITVAGIAVLHA